MNTRSLADEQPLRTWAGKGSGACCHMCGRAIKAQEIEYEIELPPEGAGRCLRFHFDCYRAWDTQVKAAADANARLKGEAEGRRFKGGAGTPLKPVPGAQFESGADTPVKTRPDSQRNSGAGTPSQLKAGSAPACAPQQPLRSG